jgi:uncharacterized coiled-coil DUF342 family protein
MEIDLYAFLMKRIDLIKTEFEIESNFVEENKNEIIEINKDIIKLKNEINQVNEINEDIINQINEINEIYFDIIKFKNEINNEINTINKDIIKFKNEINNVNTKLGFTFNSCVFSLTTCLIALVLSFTVLI